MMGATLASLDLAVLALLGLMTLRGVRIGGVREAISLASLAGAVLLVRLFARPLGVWLQSAAPFDLQSWPAVLLAGALLGIGSLTLLGFFGRAARDWLRANNLGLLDRVMGALLGAMECALLVLVCVHLALTAFGPDVALLQGTRTLAFYERASAWFGEHGDALLPDTARAPDEASAFENLQAALASKVHGAMGSAPGAKFDIETLCETPRETLTAKFGLDPELLNTYSALWQPLCGPGGRVHPAPVAAD